MEEPLQQIEPAVARGKFIEELWDDPNHLAEEKLDGERFKMHMFKNGNRFDSRTISKKTNRYTEKTGNVPHLASLAVPALAGSVFDGEIKFGDDSMSTSTIMGCLPEEAVERQIKAGKFVSYFLFDVIYYKGNYVGDLPYYVRKEIVYKEYMNHFKGHEHFLLPKCTINDKKAFCEKIWAEGGEGIILKNVRAVYGDKKAWIKVKKVSTFDVVVIGYEEATPETIKKGDDVATISRLAANGWIGALVFGQYVNGKLKKFGRCSGMPDDVRKDFSENKEARIGTVITIEAQSRIPKTGYFRHPRYLKIREDKDARQCVYSPNEK